MHSAYFHLKVKLDYILNCYIFPRCQP